MKLYEFIICFSDEKLANVGTSDTDLDLSSLPPQSCRACSAFPKFQFLLDLTSSYSNWKSVTSNWVLSRHYMESAQEIHEQLKYDTSYPYDSFPSVNEILGMLDQRRSFKRRPGEPWHGSGGFGVPGCLGATIPAQVTVGCRQVAKCSFARRKLLWSQVDLYPLQCPASLGSGLNVWDLLCVAPLMPFSYMNTNFKATLGCQLGAASNSSFF